MSHPDEPLDDGSQRYKRIDLQRKVSLKFKEFQGFVTEYSENISAGGMFIRTKEPQAPGSMFDFEFTLGEDFTLIHGLGEVVWVRDEDEGFDRPAGMGVRFLSLDEKSRELIDRMVAERLTAQRERVAAPVAPDTHWGMAGDPAGGGAPPGEPAGGPAEDETVAEGVPSWLPSPTPPATNEGTARPSLFDMLPDPGRGSAEPIAGPDETAADREEPDDPKRPPGPSPYARSYPVASAQVAVGKARSRVPWIAGAVVGLVLVAVVAGGLVLFPERVRGWIPWGGDGEAQVAEAGEAPGDGVEGPDQAAADGERPAGVAQPEGPEEPGEPAAVDEAGGEEVAADGTTGVMGMVGEEPEDQEPAAGRSAPRSAPEGEQRDRFAIPPAPEPEPEPASVAPSQPSSGGSVPLPPAPEEEPFSRVLNITWEQLEGELLVTIHLDGAVREWDYSHVRVGSPPPRELVIIRGVREPFVRKSIPVAAAMVDQIRVGFHPKRGGEHELHVVLDVARPTVYVERMEASGREIRLYVTVRRR